MEEKDAFTIIEADCKNQLIIGVKGKYESQIGKFNSRTYNPTSSENTQFYFDLSEQIRDAINTEIGKPFLRNFLYKKETNRFKESNLDALCYYAFEKSFAEWRSELPYNSQKENFSSKKILTDISQINGQYNFSLGFKNALTHLLALQYPWGEWSDERTSLQSELAERKGHRGPEGPKPNVARTLFSIEILKYFQNDLINESILSAYNWMLRNIENGWYKEWLSTTSDDSDFSVPNLIMRNDIRHTAQVGTAICWQNGERSILSAIVQNISKSFNKVSGCWAESEGETKPKLLSTIYAIELLGLVVNGSYRLTIHDLLNTQLANDVTVIYKKALLTIEDELNQGNGLIGVSFGKQSPYATGMTLFRLSSLVQLDKDIHSIVLKMINALENCKEKNGWFDYNAPLMLQESTRKRTTLRIAAGIGKSSSFIELKSNFIVELLNIVEDIISDSLIGELDSPDYACALIALITLSNDTSYKNVLNDSNFQFAITAQSKIYSTDWIDDYNEYLNNLSIGLKYGVDNYDKLATNFHDNLLKINQKFGLSV